MMAGRRACCLLQARSMPTPRMCSLGGIWKGLHPAEAVGLSHGELCSIWVLQQMGPGQPLALIGVRLGSIPRPVGTAAVFPLVVTLEHFKSKRLRGLGSDFKQVFPLTFHISQTGLCALSPMGLKFDSCFFFFFSCCSIH